MNSRTVAAFMLLALGFACDADPRHSPDWMAGRDSTGFLPLRESGSLCPNCITLEQLVELGDDRGPGFVEETHDVLRDDLGRYWVRQRDLVKVFGPTGIFEREVGQWLADAACTRAWR